MKLKLLEFSVEKSDILEYNKVSEKSTGMCDTPVILNLQCYNRESYIALYNVMPFCKWKTTDTVADTHLAWPGIKGRKRHSGNEKFAVWLTAKSQPAAFLMQKYKKNFAASF